MSRSEISEDDKPPRLDLQRKKYHRSCAYCGDRFTTTNAWTTLCWTCFLADLSMSNIVPPPRGSLLGQGH